MICCFISWWLIFILNPPLGIWGRILISSFIFSHKSSWRLSNILKVDLKKKNAYSLSNEYFKLGLSLSINSELKNSAFGKKVSILSNDSYHQLQQVNFNQIFGVRQRYWKRASLFWQDLSLIGTKPFISASFILYIHQGISISDTRFQFTKYFIFFIKK